MKEDQTMQKVITVRGMANVKVKPDYVNVLIKLVTLNMDYSDGMAEAARRIESLKDALKGVDVDSEDLRTTDFHVDTEWEWLKDEKGNYKEHVFKGYKVCQDLKIGFDFDRKRLVEILAAIAKSDVDPEFSVRFTVKDTSAVQDELFAKASVNARKIAEGLCRGVGKKLGDVLNINYSWHEIEIHREIRDFCAFEEVAEGAPDINPDDLEASDSVVFTWEIV